MSTILIASITIFAVSCFLGAELIGKVPTLLHTPLMSGTNAISGIVLVGAILVAGHADGVLENTVAFLAVVLSTINVVGGYLVTDRMLGMFRKKTDGDGPA